MPWPGGSNTQRLNSAPSPNAPQHSVQRPAVVLPNSPLNAARCSPTAHQELRSPRSRNKKKTRERQTQNENVRVGRGQRARGLGSKRAGALDLAQARLHVNCNEDIPLHYEASIRPKKAN